MTTESALAWPRAYFGAFLGARLGRPLLPGLHSLSTAFTLEVAGGETYAIEITAGCITRAEATDAASPLCHLRIEPDDLARVVAGEVSPQALFVRRRVTIRGNPWNALRASSAMEEFCRRFPYRPPEHARP